MSKLRFRRAPNLLGHFLRYRCARREGSTDRRLTNPGQRSDILGSNVFPFFDHYPADAP
ncbi:uncharacterized protein METZ01_LOCUS81197 [marine metagenome]|uniref:Uncharacterized protein n=1 Tax=marine metagenome TaxID=408172 RepID=A0A381UNF2_9ZZZZ